MSEINNSGNTSPIRHPIGSPNLDPGNIENIRRIAGGHLDGDEFSVSNRDGDDRNDVRRSHSGPQLEEPSDTSITQLEDAFTQVGEISERFEEALRATRALIAALASGELTPEQVAQLKQHAATLLGASEYLDNLRGIGLDGAEGKQNLLAALGFNDAQLAALLSLANLDDVEGVLANRHGGAQSLESKASILKSLGFSDGQVDALLSLANPGDDASSLVALHQGGATPRQLLEAFGFQGAQVDKLLSVLNGSFDTAEFSEQMALFQRMGLSEGQAKILLGAGDDMSIDQQRQLIRSNSAEQSEFMRNASQRLDDLAAVAKGFEQNLVDVFAIMELLHQLSVEQRKNARESRAVNYDAAKQQILNQAEKMKSAALKTAIAGYISAGFKIGAGLAQGTFAVRSGYAPNQGAMQQQVAYGNAIGSVLGGMGDVGKTAMDYQAAGDHAQVKVHEALQKTYDNAAQSDSEFMNLHQDMIRSVQSKMDEIIRSWFETLKSTTRV